MDTWIEIASIALGGIFTVTFGILAVIWRSTREEIRILRSRYHDLADRLAALEGHLMLKRWE